ncbi:DUF6702 family protein [Sediminibacterium ginsengisoli]|uniref:Uncharacterized protein n=1 Tax=Sediminibacterium ginsengisoli TaxID=413434 RepID=A0A1T4QVH4_9BACT|nr:DUF6702 family protein [Sediminibacterium ginsengisoli]SKA07318.1 hypothetical protein SAMN04488132_109113 [Sediminibacterium ginsengisoli]
MANIMVQWLMGILLPLFHPYFVSVVDLNHNKQEETVEISIRVYTDDLEKTIQKYSTAKIDLINPPNKAVMERQLAAYISQTVKLKLNGQAVYPRFIGYEQQQESTWCYFEVEKIPALKTADIDCKLLYDYETSQTNLLHVKSNGVEKSYKLDYPKNLASFNF